MPEGGVDYRHHRPDYHDSSAVSFQGAGCHNRCLSPAFEDTASFSRYGFSKSDGFDPDIEYFNVSQVVEAGSYPAHNAAQQLFPADRTDSAFFGVDFGTLRLLVVEVSVAAAKTEGVRPPVEARLKYRKGKK